ncbi:YciI family protein [Pseudomonas sp. NPDC089554]|uniref:YciI family protein n=1 Tax=Pseudomonas sp. NPDC089554 TaxID=3390653 RepID=UPI003CFD4176
MLYVIYCKDNPSKPTRREAFYEAHRAYLKQASLKILIAGPYTSEQSDKKIGSLLVVEANTLEQALNFQRNDPFAREGVWSEVLVHPFLLSIDQLSKPR